MSLRQAVKDLAKPKRCAVAKALDDIPAETVAELYELRALGVDYPKLCAALEKETGLVLNRSTLGEHFRKVCCCDGA